MFPLIKGRSVAHPKLDNNYKKDLEILFVNHQIIFKKKDIIK